MRNTGLLKVVLGLLIVLTLGCNFFSNLLKAKSPVVSVVAPELPAPPKPSNAAQGTAAAQAAQFADMLALPETRLAGWLGIYDALGIPVVGQDGRSLGSTGDDPIGPRYWQVWYVSGLDKKGRGIPINDVGRLFATETPALDGAALGTGLLDDLRLAMKSNDPQVRLMGEFVRERIKRWPSHLDIADASVTPDTAIIDLPTVQMIAWITMRGALFQNAARITKATIAPPATFMMAMFQGGGGSPAPQVPCSEQMGSADSTYWTNWLANKVVGGGVQLPGMTKAFTGLLEKMQKVLQVSEKGIEKTAAVITKLNAISALLNLILQISAMEIEPKQIPDPMVRTKDTNRGKDGTIELQLYSAPDKIPDGNKLGACLGAFFTNAFGISFSFPAKGPISGAEMTVSGGAGFPNLVLFNTEGTNSMRRWTDASGIAEYKLIGAPQRRDLPQTAKETKKEFSVHVKAQPEEAGLNSMLNIFFGGLTFGSNSTKAGGFGSAIDIAKGFQYDMGEYYFNLTDWKMPGYKATGQTADLAYSGVICSLERPFTVFGSIINYKFEFTPTSATGGTATITAAGMMVTSEGGGNYTIERADTDDPRIAFAATAVGHSPVGSKTGSGILYIDLVPLDTDECS